MANNAGNTARLFAVSYATARNRFFRGKKVQLRTFSLALLAACISAALYLVTIKGVGYFKAQDELGILLSMKILQMSWLLFFALLLFSTTVAAVSSFYLSQDNEIIVSAPIPLQELFRMRLITTSLSTTWMVLFFSLPVFAAYGTLFAAPWFYWPLLLVSLFSTTFTASTLATLITILLISLFPAKRTKDIILYLSLCFGLFLYLVFRLIRPEDLVNPEQFGQFIEYFDAISGPSGPWIPAGWAADILIGSLLEQKIDWLLAGLLITTPLLLFFIGEVVMEKFFISGFSKSQESFGGHRRFRQRIPLQTPLANFCAKELRQFTRDSGEWSQFFMIAALVVVYLYNFKALPLDRAMMPTVYMSNLIAFANIGLAGFIAASLSSRFVYPSIGAEKGAFFTLIAASPLSIGRFLFYKYLFYLLPFSLLTAVLVAASNHLLEIEGVMRWLSLACAELITWTVVAMSLCFGAIFADFKAESKNASLGVGAIIFLFAAVGYELLVIVTGFRASWRIVSSEIWHWNLWQRGIPEVSLWLGGIAVLSFAVVFLLWRRAVRALGVQG